MMADDDDAQLAFVELVEDLINAEDARKSSIETRAFAAITVDLTLVTIYIAASSHSKFIAGLDSGHTSGYISAAFACVLMSVVLGFVGALPFSYGTFKVSGLQMLNTSITDGTLTLAELQEKVRTIRMEQLDSSRKQNGIKVGVLFAASAGAAGAVFCFILAVLLGMK